jgi:hypothetical protein
MIETAIHRRVAACRAGTDPTVICRMPAGWAVMGDPQVLRGYCLLLPDPVVTGALRINYAIFGNVEPALHAHVFPRYVDEPEALRTANPWGYDWAVAPRFDVGRQGALLAMIRGKCGR